MRDLRRILGNPRILEKIGPQWRMAARRALREGDPRRLRQLGRQIVGELLRRGLLVRVAVAGDDRPRGTLFLLRDSNELLDLSVLTPGEIPEAAPMVAPAPASRPDATARVPSVAALEGMLGAMEAAQDLEVGDPHSAVAEIVLGGILTLLERFLPDLQLFLLLDHGDAPPQTPPAVIGRGGLTQVPFWLQHRPPGAATWLPDARELPQPLRQALRLGGQDVVAAAVPILEPVEMNHESGGEPHEKGLLFVVAPPTWPDQVLMRLAARLAAFVTRRWRQQWTVNQRIHTDSLTGVHNRAFFDSQFTIELERARRGDFPLVLVLGDLDEFKRVNDTHGHHAGDLVLQEVARRLQGALRRIDHICRIGGEEFALILPHTRVDEAHDVMSRLLARPYVTRATNDDAGKPIAVTMSYGVVTYPEAGSDPFELYRKADAMLYLSKDQGRNRCYVWSEDGRHQVLLPPGRDL